MDPETFKQRAIWQEDYPDHADFLSVLKDDVLKDASFVKMMNLRVYYDRQIVKGR